VAVVTETWPPEINGVAATLARVAEGLRERGHSCSWCARARAAPRRCRPKPRCGYEVLMRGLPIPRYPQLKMGLPAARAAVGCGRLQRPDLVHIATEGPLGWSALQAARR
jgi:hypothetical protein